MDLRLVFSLFIGKLIFYFTRVLKFGGGSAAPGYYALKIDPQLINKLSRQIPKSVIITGTNGKTTTARLLSHLVQKQKLSVIRNYTGSNLERGIASTLIEKTNLNCRMDKVDLAIWELDEAAFNRVVFQIHPELIVFLNAYRDQLDRYGEVDSVVRKWSDSLQKIDWPTTILVNGNDDHTLHLSSVGQLSTHIFQVNNIQPKKETTFHNDIKQIKVDYQANIVKNQGLEGTIIELIYPGGKELINFSIPGIYHVYDLLAALSVYHQLKLPMGELNSALKNYLPAFGRVEKQIIKGKPVYIFLIKNPVGATMVFETLKDIIEQGDALIIALNDNFADGTDVSWIWDSEFETLVNNQPATILCSGKRVYDLALRIKYCQNSPKEILTYEHLRFALDQALSTTNRRIFILPTYTAMLELQDLLTKMKVKSAYWKEN